MPELPEVQTVVSELNKKLRNRKIAQVSILMGKMVSLGPEVVSNIRITSQTAVDNFAKLITGKKVLAVRRRGKMLLFDLTGNLTLLVHLKMTGQFIFEDKVQRQKTGGKYRILNKKTAPLVQLPMKHTHVIFRFTDSATLFYNDIRQFGYMRLVENKDLGRVREFSEYGPEPLGKDFNFEKFYQGVTRKSKTPIKLALMEPKVVVGIGNIYSDEILYHAKIRPDRKVGSLTQKELKAIFSHIKPVLRLAVKAKGSSVGDFIRTDGKWGQMGRHHFVYGRKNQPCLGCGTMILSMKLGGRTSCYCPQEQK